MKVANTSGTTSALATEDPYGRGPIRRCNEVPGAQINRICPHSQGLGEQGDAKSLQCFRGTTLVGLYSIRRRGGCLYDVKLLKIWLCSEDLSCSTARSRIAFVLRTRRCKSIIYYWRTSFDHKSLYNLLRCLHSILLWDHYKLNRSSEYSTKHASLILANYRPCFIIPDLRLRSASGCYFFIWRLKYLQRTAALRCIQQGRHQWKVRNSQQFYYPSIKNQLTQSTQHHFPCFRQRHYPPNSRRPTHAPVRRCHAERSSQPSLQRRHPFHELLPRLSWSE